MKFAELRRDPWIRKQLENGDGGERKKEIGGGGGGLVVLFECAKVGNFEIRSRKVE